MIPLTRLLRPIIRFRARMAAVARVLKVQGDYNPVREHGIGSIAFQPAYLTRVVTYLYVRLRYSLLINAKPPLPPP